MTDKEITGDLMNQLLKRRIRILKTGLFGVDRHINMDIPENRVFFEKLAVPGTELKLKRIYDHPVNPFRINVYSKDGKYLGRVTEGKDQTAARLMDAGFSLVAIVNESLPFHDSDYNYGIREKEGDTGWTDRSRVVSGHTICNLPYGIYLEDDLD
ncbi:MAG: hypothetical protein J6I56_02890 [Lachnospiraceae bacterium]|nr:hypothetical protein [Lachnospiraceae bacterium]